MPAAIISTIILPVQPCMLIFLFHLFRCIMPFITIDLFAGRDTTTKRELAAAITKETCRIMGCKPEAVHVRFNEVKREDWATAGVLWSEKS